MLQQLIREEPLTKVADAFGIERGFLQNLCSSATGFAGMVQTFCGKVGWANLALLLGGFKERLVFGLSGCEEGVNGRCAGGSFGDGQVTVCQGVYGEGVLGRWDEICECDCRVGY
jgi:hypothetical protein